MSDLTPKSWAEISFGDLNQFASRTIDPSAQPDKEFELYSVPVFPTGKPEILLGQAIGSTKQTVQPQDVLVCKINPRINRVWEVSSAGAPPQIASSEWIGFRVQGMEQRYFRRYFSSPEFREKICSDVTGVGGSLTRAQPKNVAKFVVPIAPLPEQKRIANKLDSVLARVDACRDRLDHLPALLKRFRQSILAAATSGQLTEDWRSGKTPSWENCKLGDLLKGKPRNGYSPKAVDYCTPVKSLTLSATTSGKFKSEHIKFIDESIPTDSHLWLKPNDILIQRANTLEYVGVSAIFQEEADQYIYPDLMMKCEANQKVLPEFLLFTLSAESMRTYFRENATGTAGNMPKINQQTVINAPALLPPLGEQTEIVRHVEILFAFADRLEARLAAARRQVGQLTPALLAKAFRGELVPQDPADEPAAELLKRLAAQREAAPKAKRGRSAA